MGSRLIETGRPCTCNISTEESYPSTRPKLGDWCGAPSRSSYWEMKRSSTTAAPQAFSNGAYPSPKDRSYCTEIHSGACGHHAAPRALVGNTFRQGFYWPTMVADATRNIHRHSRCHYKWNFGSTPAGMNNLYIGGPAGRQTPGGSPAATAAAATTTSVSGGKTAAATASGKTLLLKGPRSRPLAGDENQPLKPKSRRPGPQVAPTVSSVEKPSPVATYPPTPHQQAAAAQKRTGRSSLPFSPRERERDRPRTRVPPSRRTTCCATP
jgi:hypothetical protein